VELIQRNRCIDMIRNMGTDAGLSPRNMIILTSMVESVPFVKHDSEEYCQLNDIMSFAQNFRDAVKHSDSSFLHRKRGLKYKIVDFEEFAESREYLDQKASIRPRIKQELMRLFNPANDFIEVVLGGAIGVGKNYFNDLAMAYMLYRLSCYHDPQLEFGLAPGSSMIFIMQSKSEKLAKKVIFDQFASKLARSPYFTKLFPYDKNVKSEMRFPNQISVLPVGGNETAALGMNVWSASIDEMNFMTRTTDSMHVRFSNESEYDQAQVLYNHLIRRMYARFQEFGKIPGKLILISSTNYEGDFISRKIEEAQTDDSIFVMSLAQWESVPAEKYCGEKFLVEVGNTRKRTRIVNSKEEAVDPDDVVEVPVEYRKQFETDPEGSMRDLGGRAVAGKNKFIPFREQIEECFQKYEEATGGRTLFRYPIVDFSQILDMDRPDFSEIVDLEYIRDFILDPAQVFAIHGDPGLTGDVFGLSVGRIVGYVFSQFSAPPYEFEPHEQELAEMHQRITSGQPIRLPIFMIDGLMGIAAPHNDEVDFDTVRDLVLFLKRHVNIQWATADTYQSANMIQGFRRAGIRSGPLSVDGTKGAVKYLDLKYALKDTRVWLPRIPLVQKELTELIRKPDGSIDHPRGGSKDLADGVCGTTHILFRKEAVKDMRQRRPRGNRPISRRPTRKLRGRRKIRRIL